eukprot:589263-Prymnesium_polylepis.1
MSDAPLAHAHSRNANGCRWCAPPRKPDKRPLEEYSNNEAGGDDMHWAPQQAAHRAAQLAALSHWVCHLECSVVSQLSLLQQK